MSAAEESTRLLPVEPEDVRCSEGTRHRRVAPAVVGAALALAGTSAVAWHSSKAFTSADVNALTVKASFPCGAAFEAQYQNGVGDQNYWRCFNGPCILASQRCDGQQTCEDGSDETYCPDPHYPYNGPAAAAGYGAPAPVPGYPVPAPVPAPVPGYGYPAPAPYQAPAPAAADGQCFNKAGLQYHLDWSAQGQTFFQEWEYMLNDPNSGGAQYLDANQAYQEGLTAAYPDKAIIKAGGQGDYLKRKSVKIRTTRKWKYFLMALKFESVPWGCGVWPAFWMNSPEKGWPQGGELDILEYSNEIRSRSSLHVGAENRCQLNGALLNKPGCRPFLDAEYMFTGHYDCVTNYPEQIGCAPNDKSLLKNGRDISATPGVMAVEWTADFIKVFHIPEAYIPADLTADAPQPDTWDQYIVAYYPLAESERTVPGSCPNPADVLLAQQIILSLGFCGDWAAKVWSNSTCANQGYPSNDAFTAKGPVMNSQCVAVDPHNPMGEQPGGPRDCCTQYIYDQDGSFGTQQHIDEHGKWTVNYLKVYQAAAR